ncbi:MAG: DUF4406 domain-containing protein [Candidatus Omnitrophica bacterium]|nr:DUF4406 domain-containing protein [Candidatus Omnitrophota bacterium]MDD5592438.1 DUF4406 domain-containing protein [Candidatus Omnitrophota bacterium]
MNKRRVIVYISGPYRGDIEENICKARQMSIEIWKAGYTVICPHLNTFHFEKDCTLPEKDYIMGDIEILRRVDIVFMLENWQKSEGANIEHEEAFRQGIPIVYNLEHLEAWYAAKPTVPI